MHSFPKLVNFHITRSYVNEEGRVVADPNILTDLLYGAPTNHRDIKVRCNKFYSIYSFCLCMLTCLIRRESRLPFVNSFDLYVHLVFFCRNLGPWSEQSGQHSAKSEFNGLTDRPSNQRYVFVMFLYLWRGVASEVGQQHFSLFYNS